MLLLQEAEGSLHQQQAIRDLDMLKIFTAIDPRMDEKASLRFVDRYFSSDPYELKERLSFLSQLQTLTTASALQDAIDLLTHLQEEETSLSSVASRFGIMLYQWRRLAAYVKAIRRWNELLSKPAEASSCPDESDTSARLESLREFFAGLKNESLFSQCEAALKELNETCPLPRFLHVGMNLREDGMPVEMGVIQAEGQQDLMEEEMKDVPLNALLSCDDPSMPSLSLGPEFVYNRALYGSHFDEYLERNMEHEWKNKISKALKILEKITLTRTGAMIDLIEPLSFYQEGLLFYEAFSGRGYPLCRPKTLGGASLNIQNALYPDFILHHDHIQGNDLVLMRGNAVMITGPNHSGKTSYLKTIGQCYFLAQLGFFVPADSMVFDPVHMIYTLFSAGEDSSMSVSRMGVEVQKLTAILKNAAAEDLVLLNEPMTSTNPVEAVSILRDLTNHFLDAGITHLLVTHLYDVYYLLKASLSEENLEKLESLITESHYDEEKGTMIHHYHLIAHEPLGNSYARETAVSYDITLDKLIPEASMRLQAEEYLSKNSIDSIYEERG